MMTVVVCRPNQYFGPDEFVTFFSSSRSLVRLSHMQTDRRTRKHTHTACMYVLQLALNAQPCAVCGLSSRPVYLWCLGAVASKF